VLARAWGSSIELFAVDVERSQYLKNWSTADSPELSDLRKASIQMGQRYTSPATIVALEWLRPDILLYMDSGFELVVLSVGEGMTMMEAMSVAQINMVYSSPHTPRLPPLPSTSATSATSVASKAKQSALLRAHGAKSFQNTFRALDQRLYLLGRRELQVARVQTWMERVLVLKSSGEWIEALLLALDHHAGLHGKGGKVARHPDDADIADLLMEYVDISLGGETSTAAVAGVLTFKIIGEVCIDYCASIRRTDMLFGPIFDRYGLVVHVGGTRNLEDRSIQRHACITWVLT
jgi:hypothetical protein